MNNMKNKIKSTLILVVALMTACAFSWAMPSEAFAATKCKAPVISAEQGTQCDEVVLTCKGGGKNANTYLVYMKPSGESFSLVKKVSCKDVKEGTVVSFKGLETETTYSFKVKAANSYKKTQYFNSKTKKWQNKRPAKKNWKGKKTRKVYKYRWHSAYSAVSSVTTVSNSSAGDPDEPTAVPKPKNLRYTSTDTSITLLWDEVPGATNYKVISLDTMRSYNAGTDTSKTFNDLEPNTEHTYMVKVIMGDCQGEAVEITAKTKALSIAAPANIRGTAGPSNVFLQWDAVNTAQNYKVYDGNKKALGTTAGCNYTVNSVNTSNKTSFYVVAGKNGQFGEITSANKVVVDAYVSNSEWPVDPDIYLDYGQTRIFLGQDWDNTLCNQLKSASNGFEQVSRPGLAKPSDGGSKYYDVTKYMFDINDYDHFLAIEVAGGKIIMWETAGPTFGVIRGTTVQWGDCVKNYTYGIMTGYRTDGACNNVFTDIDKGDTVVGGFGSDYSVNKSNLILENEKRIGYHYINAYRVAGGRCILSYCNGLDGKNYTWSGEVMGKTYTNTRYGTQAFVETVAASKKVSHDTSAMTSGPLAGQTALDRLEITAAATGIVMSGENVATGGLGESCLGSYMSSSPHLVQVLCPEYTKIGLGIQGNYNAQEYAK